MPDKIFLLPDDGALVAERLDDESSSVREPLTREQFVARLVAAVPDDWSDMSGQLDAADPDAVWDTGYEFHRHGSGVRVVARRRFTPHDKIPEVVRPDPVALFIDQRPPGFISFVDAGYNSKWELLVARDLAVGFVRRGYRGWLSINNGRGREYAHQKPAQVDLHLRSWSCFVDVGTPPHPMPPAVVLSWDESCGGSLEQLEPLHAICRRALQEWTGDLGEAVHG